MSNHAITITPGEWPGGARIRLDDTDISNAVRGIDVSMEAGNLPQVTVELRIDEIRRIDSEHAVVLIPSSTRDALVALGWTPPQEAK
jgi:hypothetical protein